MRTAPTAARTAATTMDITTTITTACTRCTTARCSPVSFSTDTPLDPERFFPWVQQLVATEGPNILRSKGILSFKDDPDRFVFQGVHMILDGDHQRPWKADEKRQSRIVFIGRKLDVEGLRTGFLSCETA